MLSVRSMHASGDLRVVQVTVAETLTASDLLPATCMPTSAKKRPGALKTCLLGVSWSWLKFTHYNQHVRWGAAATPSAV